MAIVDERGRLFGRLNLFDAIVLVLILWLIPIAYGSYRLFRTPPPELTAVEPATIVSSPDMKIRVRGRNFVPYLRVSVGLSQGKTFKFNDTTDAEVDLLEIAPGVYDVILYDNSQERDRIPNGLTVTASPLPETKLTAVGTFGNLTAAQAQEIKPGTRVGGFGVVTRVGKPRPQTQRVFVRPDMVEISVNEAQMVPAELALTCYVRSQQGQPECVGAGASVQPLSMFFFDMPFGKVPFQMEQVRSAQPLVPVKVTVRFTADPRVLSGMQPGDRDKGNVGNELAATATIDSLGAGGGSSRDVRLTVQAQQGADGWLYANNPLRLGSPFTLQNERYEVHGVIVGMDPAPASK